MTFNNVDFQVLTVSERKKSMVVSYVLACV